MSGWCFGASCLMAVKRICRAWLSTSSVIFCRGSHLRSFQRYRLVCENSDPNDAMMLRNPSALRARQLQRRRFTPPARHQVYRSRRHRQYNVAKGRHHKDDASANTSVAMAHIPTLNKSVSLRKGSQIDEIPQAKLAQNVGLVRADCFVTHRKCFGDFLIAVALRQVAQDSALPFG
jgi:hypothetical protein